MPTFALNKDTTKVIGLINPCHKPNQKPAASGLVLVSSFGPAAHAASSSSAPMSSTAYLAPDRIRSSLSMTLAFSLGRCDRLSTGHHPWARLAPPGLGPAWAWAAWVWARLGLGPRPSCPTTLSPFDAL